MSIERSQSQKLFESIFTVGANPPFKQIKKDTYENTPLTPNNAKLLNSFLLQDAINLYYKALISFSEAYNTIKHNSYSWPTIELYYSVFYASKAFLNLRGFAILRAERRLFYIKAYPNEKFSKCTNTTDHKATFEILEKFFLNDDYLLSNKINGMYTYNWIMTKREDINYRDCSFKDPEPPEFWKTINIERKKYTIKTIVEKLANDSAGLYVFQPEYAVLGIPIKRILITADVIKDLGLITNISELQKNYNYSLLAELSDSLKSRIIF